MKLFKKKYKRSEWFEGLLLAEKLIQEGYQVNSTWDEPLWFTKLDEDCGAKMICTIRYDLSGKRDGAIDYIEHYQKYLQ